MSSITRPSAWSSTKPLLVHLRLHYQLAFLSPLFIWGFTLGGARLTPRALIAFLAFHVCLYGGITAYNSYYDRDEGPVGGLRVPPRVTGALLPFSLAVQALGLVLAFDVGAAFVAVYVLVMLLSVLYSHPRFRLKARPVGALVVVALGQGSVGFLAGWLAGDEPPHALLAAEPLLGLGVATLSTVGLYPLTQLYQLEEDAARGDKTFAVAFGADASFRFAFVCTLLAAGCVLPLAWRRFGSLDAGLLGVVFTTLLAVIERWRRRFVRNVERNFVVLHRLQWTLSLGMLGYMTLRIALS